MWNLIGAAVALGIAVLAWQRGRSAAGGFYDDGVYGMAPAIHRRYALVSAVFALFFIAMFALQASTAGLAGLALYVLIAILYASSFLRGASDYHE
jgi:hypothetical protein